MSNSSLYTTRQLTEYRTWPDGRKGCLFYLLDDSFYPKWTNDMIVLVETPARQMDILGKYDTLHIAEWAAVMGSADAVIMKGFGAWLINFYLSSGKNWGIYPAKKWDEYRERKRAEEIFNTDEALFITECQDWMFQRTDYLNDLLDEQIPPYGHNTEAYGATLKKILGFAIAFPLADWLANNDTQFRLLQPKVVFHDPSDPYTEYTAQYDADKRVLTTIENDAWKVEGFRAFFMNYALANYIYNDFEKTRTSDGTMKALEILIYRLWLQGDNNALIRYEDVTIPYNDLKLREIYHAYKEIALTSIYESLEKHSVSFAVKDARKRETEAVKHLFEYEWKKANKPNLFDKCLRKLHRKLLRIGTRYFFEYLLELLNDSKEEYDFCYNLIHAQNAEHTLHPKPQAQTIEPDNEFPPKGNYVALVKWLKIQKQLGNDYYADADNNRSQMCRNLKKIIGWMPNQGSLRKRQN